MGEYSVYIHTNRTNGKVYIGITSMSPKRRWHRGSGYAQQKRFCNAIKHYGWDGFEHDVIETNLTKEEAERDEELLIAAYKANDMRYGYNIENGGVTHKFTEEQRRYLSEVHRGKTHTEESKEKNRKTHLKVGAPWMNGKKHKSETIAKMSAQRRGTNNARARAVYQYNLDGELVRRYDYMNLAKEELGISSTAHISQCCAGKRKKAHGFMWSYRLEKMAPYEREWRGGHKHG